MKLLLECCRSVNYNTKIFLVNLIVLLYLFRTTVPIFKYPFLALYVFSLLFIFLSKRNKIANRIVVFIKNYILLILLFVIFCYSSFFSDKIYLVVFKDVANIMLLLSLFFLLSFLITNKKELKILFSSFLKLIVFFSILICLFSLLDLFDIYRIFLENFPEIDRNFATIPVFLGFLVILHLLSGSSHKIKLFYNFLLIIFFISISLSGSRRALIVMIIVLIVLLSSQFFTLLKKNTYLKRLGFNTRVFLILLILISIAGYSFINHTSYNLKNNCLELLGSKNIFLVKRRISLNVYRGLFGTNVSFSYVDLHKKLWSIEFDPIYPHTGWAYRDCQRVHPLTGTNVQIVPDEAIGCLIDSAYFRDFSSLVTHNVIYSRIENIQVKNDDIYKLSVYCFASNEFDGINIRFGIPPNAKIKRELSDNLISYYDIKNKGEWQKLEFKIVCNDGIIPIYFSIVRNKEKDFSKMKGHVIFAYPLYEKLESVNSNLSKVDVNDKECKDEAKKKQDKYLMSLEVNRLNNNVNSKLNSQASLFNGSFLSLLKTNSNDKDLIRNWTAEFVSEDTIYYGFKSKIQIDTISNKFLDPRILRWQFAWQIFKKEYSWKQKIFGGGFSFLNWYGYYFHHDKTRSDWPHNPFLSVLLYSGILGLLLYLVLMYKVFYYYIKYIKEYYLLFIFFLITFFFSFFSAGNPFDPPMMGFFVILPFFIHAIHKKDMSELKNKE